MKRIKNNIEYCSDILCKRFTFDSDNIHVISSEDYEQSDDYYYCYDCCLKKVNEINKQFPEDEDEYEDKYEDKRAFIDGGWGGCLLDSNDEGPNFCGTCGKMLDYSLSKSGVKIECNYYLKKEIKEIDDDMAFELYNILECSREWDLNIDEEKNIDILTCKILLVLGETIKDRFEILDIRK